jgi:hypothetical protein
MDQYAMDEFFVGVAHLRHSYPIKQEISSANALPS